jgi:hypothetical protein
LLLAVAGVAAWLHIKDQAPPVPAWRHRIAAAATSQVGYRTSPSDSYCNRYSAYWGYGLADRGPDVVNGDGDRTGFSVVETGTDEYEADTGRSNADPLAGYVAPLPPTS